MRGEKHEKSLSCWLFKWDRVYLPDANHSNNYYHGNAIAIENQTAIYLVIAIRRCD